MMVANVVDLIMLCAAVPSFSSYEDRLHPLIRDVLNNTQAYAVETVAENNLVAFLDGRRPGPPVALAAHLDKINHFGPDTTFLPVRPGKELMVGQLDDSVGIGICLGVALLAGERCFPPIYLLLSEMEESFGLHNHPHLLRNRGQGLYPRIGAERIAGHLLQSGRLPAMVITIDTTPFFHGAPGLALYSRHWEKNRITPSAALMTATDRVQHWLQERQPEIRVLNNINDYVKYGEVFAGRSPIPIPSIALEPAIWPYHQEDEGVHIGDIEKALALLTTLLSEYDFSEEASSNRSGG